MTDRKSCPDCGGSLPPDALDGACPRCLLAAALDDEPGGDGGEDDACVEASGAAPRRPEPPPVEEIARHFPSLVIEALIGAGGMGIVYRARQTSLDRLVALKVLWPQLASEKAFSERFTREARAMARLDHPNIVRVFEFGQRDGLCFLIMEHVDGKSLRELMDEGAIRPEEALAIVPQICAALQYAHDQGVVHRDIKPANVLVDTRGRVRIADFGLAKLVEGEDVTLTRAGQVMGTLHYMAPEQYRTPDHVDHRADIYSLGVVFYEMLTGDVPVGRFEAPSERVRVDVRLDQVVLRSLEREPERRYQHASEVGTAVTSISNGEAPPPAAVPAASAAAAAARPPSRLSRLAVASLVLVGVQLLLSAIALAAPPAMVLALGAGALAFLLGFVAWVRVLGSGGRLHGAIYGAVATVAPWVVSCGGVALVTAVAAHHEMSSVGPLAMDGESLRVGDLRIDDDGVRIGDWFEVNEDGVHVRDAIEIADGRVRRVGTSVAADSVPVVVHDGAALSAAKQQRLVRDVDTLWTRYRRSLRPGLDGIDLQRLEPRTPEEEQERDALGVRFQPQVPDEVVPRVAEMALERIELGAGGGHATITVAGASERLLIPIVLWRESWEFAEGLVEVETLDGRSR